MALVELDGSNDPPPSIPGVKFDGIKSGKDFLAQDNTGRGIEGKMLKQAGM